MHLCELMTHCHTVRAVRALGQKVILCFYPHPWGGAKILIVSQFFNFWAKFQNSTFCPKFNILPKIKNFATKLKILPKIKNFAQNKKFVLVNNAKKIKFGQKI